MIIANFHLIIVSKFFYNSLFFCVGQVWYQLSEQYGNGWVEKFSRENVDSRCMINWARDMEVITEEFMGLSLLFIKTYSILFQLSWNSALKIGPRDNQNLHLGSRRWTGRREGRFPRA